MAALSLPSNTATNTPQQPETNTNADTELHPEARAANMLAEVLGKGDEPKPEEAPDPLVAPDASGEKPAEKPGEKPPEQDPAKAKTIEAADLLAKAQRQHAALTRREKAIEAKEREALAKLSEVETLTDLPAIVSYLAKRQGVNEQAVWDDFIDLAKNGGKRSPEKALEREVRELRAELRTSKQPKTEEKPAEEEPVNEAEIKTNWQTSVTSLVADDSERWPSLSALPAAMVGPAALQVLEQYYEKTGIIATQQDVLDYLEGQAAPKQPAAPAAAKPKSGAPTKRVATVTNNDAATPVDTRSLTQQERDALAAKQLEALLRT